MNNKLQKTDAEISKQKTIVLKLIHICNKNDGEKSFCSDLYQFQLKQEKYNEFEGKTRVFFAIFFISIKM